MTHSKWLRGALGAAACVTSLATASGVAAAGDSPSNAELYQMILELKASQQQLVDDAAKARAEAAQAREQLEATQQELEAANEKLAAGAPAAATPPVSAAAESATPEGAIFVREADLPRGVAAWAELHVLRATHNNQDFASLSTEPSGSTEIGTTTNKIVQSNYETAYKSGASYSPGGGTDFAIAYQYFYNGKGDAKLIPPFESPQGNDYISLIATLAPPDFGQEALSATANDDFKVAIFDGEVGENLVIGEDLSLRLFGGVRYADVAAHFEAFYFGGDFDPTFGGRSNSDFGFWGIGPRVGAGGRYPLPWGFSVFGQAAVSVLVGEQEAESGFTNPADDSDTDPLYFVHRDFGVQVIPAIDVRAGLGWEHAVGEWGKGFVEGGYEFQNYFNVVEQLTWGPPGNAGAVGQSTGDLGIDGFFFRGGFRFHGP